MRKKAVPAFPRALMVAPLAPRDVAPRVIPVFHPDRKLPAVATPPNTTTPVKALTSQNGDANAIPPSTSEAAATTLSEVTTSRSRSKVIFFPRPMTTVPQLKPPR
jgi:hypothetical protein